MAIGQVPQTSLYQLSQGGQRLLPKLIEKHNLGLLNQAATSL